MIVAPRNTQPFGPPTREPELPKTKAKKPRKTAGPNRAELARDNSLAKLLSSRQVSALVITAKQAWESVRKVRDDVGKDFAAWRQAEAVKVCGRRISQALAGDFELLRSHFRNLAGHAGAAYKSAMRSTQEGERIALAKLEEECALRDLPMSYPAAIARRQFKKTNLADCSAKQLWCLVFTVRNRRAETAPPESAAVPQAKGKAREYTLKHKLPSQQVSDSIDEVDPF